MVPSTNDQPDNVQASDTALQRDIELDRPFKRGNKNVTTVTVRKPNSGALRGVSLTDLIQMEVQPLTKILPRITEPALTEAEIREMDPADLFQLAEVVT